MRASQCGTVGLKLLDHMGDRDALLGVIDGLLFILGLRVPFDAPGG